MDRQNRWTDFQLINSKGDTFKIGDYVLPLFPPDAPATEPYKILALGADTVIAASNKHPFKEFPIEEIAPAYICVMEPAAGIAPDTEDNGTPAYDVKVVSPNDPNTPPPLTPPAPPKMIRAFDGIDEDLRAQSVKHQLQHQTTISHQLCKVLDELFSLKAAKVSIHHPGNFEL